MIYGGKELAGSFRTVRRNTIQVAEDIPEANYSYRPAADVRSVGEELAHIAAATWWHQQCHGIDHKASLSGEDFGGYLGRTTALEKELTTKAQIVAALKSNGDAFATFLENLTDEQLAERVAFAEPMQPPEKTRFEMLLGAKEHEMHHRAKLMLVERLLGIVPHLTTRREQFRQAASAGSSA
jgi:uncharacterized damage-inducible protein DinB